MYCGVSWFVMDLVVVVVCYSVSWRVVVCRGVVLLRALLDKKIKHKQIFNCICPSISVKLLIKYVEKACRSLEILHIRTK